MFCFGGFVIHISCVWVILPLQLHSICVFINISVKRVLVSVLKSLFISYYLLISFNLSWEFFSISLLCMGYYINVWLLNMHLYLKIVYIISMFTAICLSTLHDILLGFTPSWGSLLCIFTDLLFHCCHPHWSAYTIVY